MKKLSLKFLILLFSAASLTSCSDDDNNVRNGEHFSIEEGVLGKWYPKGGTINGGEFIAYEGDDCETMGDYQEFLATGELKFVGYNEQCVVDETHVSPYSISGNTLYVSRPAGDREFEIVSLTTEKVILKSTYNTPDGEVTEVAHFERN